MPYTELIEDRLRFIEIEESDIVELQQDLRDTSGWWFYWSFRVRGAAGRRLEFRFTNKDVIGTFKLYSLCAGKF